MKKILYVILLVVLLPTLSGCYEKYQFEKKFTPTDISGTINGHDYVDLGLSVKWATCNVGANSPEDYGNYYAWGETTPKERYTEYNSITYGDESMSDISGDEQYDAATANWGKGWRMPTKKEFEELIDNCVKLIVYSHGVEGTLYISKKNGNNIFLPHAGYYYDKTHLTTDIKYWSSSPTENKAYGDDNAHCLCSYYSSSPFISFTKRYRGCPVRPVAD